MKKAILALFIVFSSWLRAFWWEDIPDRITTGDSYGVTVVGSSEYTTFTIYKNGGYMASGDGADWDDGGTLQRFSVHCDSSDTSGPAGWSANSSYSGGWIYASVTVLVSTTASFHFSPPYVRAPSAVGLDGGDSSLRTGYNYHYTWTFGDGTSQSGVTDNQYLVNASHVYSNAGSSPLTYYATLQITDDAGGTDSTTRAVTIFPAGSYAITVQSGSVSDPYAMPGSTVSIYADSPPPGNLYYGWLFLSGSGTIANASASSTTYTVGTSDSILRAKFVPDPPTGLNSPSHTYSSVALTWSASGGSVVAYDVYRQSNSIWLLVGSTSPSTLTFSDNHAFAGKSYGFYVRARDSEGYSSPVSNVVNVTTANIGDGDNDGLPDPIETLFSNSNPTADTSLSLKTHRPSP